MFFPLKIIKTIPKMSFPPGAHIPLPGMPPMQLIPPYVPPMGVIPISVGIMPPMMPPVMAMPGPPMMHPPHHVKMKKNYHSNNYRKPDNNMEYQRNFQEVHDSPQGPPVTVFVGNITERAPDNLVRQILQRCGIVSNWKRVQGANGKLQAFGFCEYSDPESALRAMRLLHDYELGEKKLVVKVDAKTKEKLEEYKASQKAKNQGETKESDKDDNNKEEGETVDDPLDEMTKQRDMNVANSLRHLIAAHAFELSKPPEEKETPAVQVNSYHPEVVQAAEVDSPKPKRDYDRDRAKKSAQTSNELDEMGLEEDKKNLIHREIDKFRDTYKRAEEAERDSSSKSSSSRDHNSRPTRDRGDRDSRRRDYESPSRGDRDRDSKRGSERTRERRRSRERKRDSPRRESPTVNRRRERSPLERPVVRDEWRDREKDLADDKPKDRDFDKDDDEDSYERKKQERKIKEKEAIYQERLRKWMGRERRQAKEYESRKLKLDEQKKDEAKEARRLKEFLEDYDDEKDDQKYFKGSALVRRMKEREKEIEEDIIDRQREKDELDKLKKKLFEEGHPDPEAEVARLLSEERRLMETARPQSPESEPEPEMDVSPPPPVRHHVARPPTTPPMEEDDEQDNIIIPPIKRPSVDDEGSQNSFSGFNAVASQPEESKLIGFTSLYLGGSPTQQAPPPQSNSTSPTATPPPPTSNNNNNKAKRKVTVDEVFNVDDDKQETKKKRKLIPIDDNAQSQKEEAAQAPPKSGGMTVEEKREHIRNLIEQIPTEKTELFAYTLDWSVVDKALMEKRIHPWINKKIIEYIGEEEPTLVEFICNKIMIGSEAQSILDDVSMVLDEEAEVFVVKMWRLLIYEIEAKKLGLMGKSDTSQEHSQGKT